MKDPTVARLVATARDLRRLLQGDVSQSLLVQAHTVLRRIAPTEFRQLAAAPTQPGLPPSDWRRYPLRHCQSDRRCAICGDLIDLGDLYYNAGRGRYAEKTCVDRDRSAPVGTETIV